MDWLARQLEREHPIRTIQLDGDYRREPKTEVWCVRCQKDLRPGVERRVVAMVSGESVVIHPDDVAGASGVVEFLIGPCCARQLGLEWSRPHVPGESLRSDP